MPDADSRIEREVLGRFETLALEVRHREQQRESGGRGDHHAEEDRERIDPHHAREGGQWAVVAHQIPLPEQAGRRL